LLPALHTESFLVDEMQDTNNVGKVFYGVVREKMAMMKMVPSSSLTLRLPNDSLVITR
jgi:hypothetical protein